MMIQMKKARTKERSFTPMFLVNMAFSLLRILLALLSEFQTVLRSLLILEFQKLVG